MWVTENQVGEASQMLAKVLVQMFQSPLALIVSNLQDSFPLPARCEGYQRPETLGLPPNEYLRTVSTGIPVQQYWWIHQVIACACGQFIRIELCLPLELGWV
jgi:hypothetical protein